MMSVPNLAIPRTLLPVGLVHLAMVDAVKHGDDFHEVAFVCVRGGGHSLGIAGGR